MTKVLIVGAGKIGAMCAELLSSSGDYQVSMLDSDAKNLNRAASKEVSALCVDAEDKAALSQALQKHDIVLSAAPYMLNPAIAALAKGAGVHYFDLTEDVESTREVKALAQDAQTAFVPQCGLAPGFVSIVAYDLAKRFDTLRDVQMRVGALPKYPTNALKYNLTWSTDGLINEYCNLCEAIVDGELREVPALAEVEAFSLDGITYEAFNTSGGLGTLCDTLGGQVENLNYRTVRYPGHRDIIKLLVRDLRLGQRRDLMKNIFEHALPITLQDVVLIFVTVTGEKQGQLVQETYAKKIYSREIDGRMWSAIKITTASGACAMIDLLREGKLPQAGFVKQEQASLSDFLGNRFGSNFQRADDIAILEAA